MLKFERIEEVAVADRLVVRDHAADIAILSALDPRDALRQLIIIMQIERPGRAKVADIGIVGALLVIDLLDEFRDQEIEIGIALPMSVAWHVDRHAVDADREIGAVIEVEAPQEILVGLAAAGMLRDDDAGNLFNNLAGTQDRAERNVGSAHRSLVSRRRNPSQIFLAACYDDRRTNRPRRWRGRSFSVRRRPGNGKYGRRHAKGAPYQVPAHAVILHRYGSRSQSMRRAGKMTEKPT